MRTFAYILLIMVSFVREIYSDNSISSQAISIQIQLNNETDTASVLLQNVSMIQNLTRQKFPKNMKINEDSFLIQIFDSENNLLYQSSFSFQEWIHAPPPINDDYSPYNLLSYKIKNPTLTLLCPYFPNSHHFTISNNGKIIQTYFLEQLSTQLSSTNKFYPIYSDPGHFHLLIMADGYSESNISSFYDQVQNFKNLIFSLQPFASFKDKIKIHTYENQQDIEMYRYGRLLFCDKSKAVQSATASGYLFDEIIVIHNSTEYGGGGSFDNGNYQTNSASSLAVSYDGEWTAWVAVHEFGHSFGNLCDEYLYESAENQTVAYYCANCRTNCEDFEDYSHTCQTGCAGTYQNVRPEDSLMLSLSGTFNDVSIYQSLFPRLAYFLDIDPDPNLLISQPQTNISGTLSINNSAYHDIKVVIKQNNQKAGSTVTDENGQFNFENISMNQGFILIIKKSDPYLYDNAMISGCISTDMGTFTKKKIIYFPKKNKSKKIISSLDNTNCFNYSPVNRKILIKIKDKITQ